MEGDERRGPPRHSARRRPEAGHGMGPAITLPRMVAGEVPELSAKVLVGIGDLWPVALGRAVLADDLARPSLRKPFAILEHVDRPASLRRAHHFPEAISRRASISSSLSATMRFRRWFSFSSSPQPLGIVSLHPSVLVPPSVIGGLVTWRWRATAATSAPSFSIRSASLAFGRSARRCACVWPSRTSSLRPRLWATGSVHGWPDLMGSGHPEESRSPSRAAVCRDAVGRSRLVRPWSGRP